MGRVGLVGGDCSRHGFGRRGMTTRPKGQYRHDGDEAAALNRDMAIDVLIRDSIATDIASKEEAVVLNTTQRTLQITLF